MRNFPKNGLGGSGVVRGWEASGRRLRLASASSRRLELLRQVGLEPEVSPADVDESRLAGESARAYVERMALTKARAGVNGGTDLVLGADTVVVVDDELLGKPADAAQAAAMLGRLSGRAHVVMTGVAVCAPEAPEGRGVVVESRVWFKSLNHEEIMSYIASGEPMDKAGAYGLQGLGGCLVARLEGSCSGVVGLPLCETVEILKSFGLTFSRPR